VSRLDIDCERAPEASPSASLCALRDCAARRSASSYRELVEAAENCQVAIIHPGKPKNPNEPGLDELLKRAEPFL